MEVHFTPDQQARLVEIAQRAGKNAEDVVQETVARMLDEDARFIGEVEKGFASLDRGEYIEHGEVKSRIGRMLGI